MINEWQQQRTRCWLSKLSFLTQTSNWSWKPLTKQGLFLETQEHRKHRNTGNTGTQETQESHLQSKDYFLKYRNTRDSFLACQISSNFKLRLICAPRGKGKIRKAARILFLSLSRSQGSPSQSVVHWLLCSFTFPHMENFWETISPKKTSGSFLLAFWAPCSGLFASWILQKYFPS